jgi:polyribonucleotide nucleotidyltransferase
MFKQKNSVSVEGMAMTFESGTLAKQANGSVTVRLGETTVFVAACASPKVEEGQDFFPLKVDYREKYAAAGRFPEGYFRREGAPSEKEILTSRLIDRPLRPLFPAGFMNEVQVIGLLMSADLQNEPDILMVNAASAAMMVSDIPWAGPVGCVRLGMIDGKFVVNPTNEQKLMSDLDLIYAGNERDMMMIEGSALELSEEKFIEALEFAHQAIQPIIAAQKTLAKNTNKPKKTWPLCVVEPSFLQKVRSMVGTDLKKAVFMPGEKLQREEGVVKVFDQTKEKLTAEIGEAFKEGQLKMAFEVLQEELYRDAILNDGKRADGRGVNDIRPITCGTGIFPRLHGSALFQRGETQAVVIATLAAQKDAQKLDALTGGSKKKSFILHYNFPPFSTGETGRFGGAGRREVGHGALAERSLIPVLPSDDDFPYAIRVVSEIMESNGSSSMASVCVGCLSLMDAGVPLKAPVAGISCGLVTANDASGKINKHIILTDILGAEDHFGDMDFKIAGSKNGITGFQLDLKLMGLPLSIAKEAVKQNGAARAKILEIMAAELPAPRAQLRDHAPKIFIKQIDPEKIGALIGPGGKNIRRICEVSGAQIDINEDNSGKVVIYSNNTEGMKRAIEEIDLVTAEIEIGKMYRGIVRGTKEFGAFVECLPGKEGLVHISELADFRVNRTEDVCREGDEMWVKCIAVDNMGRVKLSRRAAMQERGETSKAPQPAEDRR